MSTTQWKNIFDTLEDADFEVYAPQQKNSECKTSYVVVKNAGTIEIAGTSSVAYVYEILGYVPGNQYSLLESFMESIQTTMKTMYPTFQKGYVQSYPYYDDLVKAHMSSIQYLNYRTKK